MKRTKALTSSYQYRTVISMCNSLSLFLLASLTTLTIACSGSGATCEQAFDKAIECSENPEKARAEAEPRRKDAISTCNDEKSTTYYQNALACAKKSSCEEFRACDLDLRFGGDVKEVEEQMAAGKVSDAMRTCSVRIDTYRTVPAFKAVCDRVGTKIFANLDDNEMLDYAAFSCGVAEDAKEWLTTSEQLRTGCTVLAAEHLLQLTKERDEESILFGQVLM